MTVLVSTSANTEYSTAAERMTLRKKRHVVSKLAHKRCVGQRGS